MSRDHLSRWDLDELASGDTGASWARRHAQGCAPCRERLVEHRTRLEQARGSAGFQRVRARLAAAAPVRTGVGWRALLPVSVALAAAATVLVLLRPSSPMDHIKGSESIRIHRAGGATDSSPLKAGETVVLSVNPAGHAFALVLEDADGALTQVWPQGTDRSGPVAPGVNWLSPAFQVTPGSTKLYALFSERPLLWGQVRATFGGATHAVAGESARAVVALDVGSPSRGE